MILKQSRLRKIIQEEVQKIVETILGEYAILNLQNSIIISPHNSHHQSFYHRDIIHQDFTSSKPLIISGVGFEARVMVSPTFTSLAFFIPVMM